MRARAWLRAARPLAHANVAPPILLGVAIAAAQGFTLEAATVALAFAFGVLDHLVIVFGNDYADREGDAHHDAPTLFSGGSRVIQEGLLEPGALRRGAVIAAVALLALSVVGALALARPFLPAFAAAALALLHMYSYPPLRLAYRGFGEILQGVGVGAVLPLVGYSCAAGTLEGFPLEVLAPLVILGFASNVITALPDVAADRLAEKNTWPVRRGELAARRDALALVGLAVVLATQVGPALSWDRLAIALGPPALAILLALRELKRADAANRDACVRFVALAAGAGIFLQLGWAVALFLGS